MYNTIVKYSLIGLLTLGILGACGAFGAYLWASKDLPSITQVSDYRMPLTTTVYDRDKNIIGYFSKERRFLVNYDQIPDRVIKAFVAIEDSRFFEHPGVDLKAIFRAFVTNVRAGRVVEGGSTITQQLIKRMVVGPEKSLKRKAQEAILAYQLENYLSKEEILYLYLNEIYLGQSSYGIEAAARAYFGKHVQDITLAEAALLAGLPKAPTQYNPYLNPKEAENRQHLVLMRMREVGFITPEEEAAARQEKPAYRAMPDPTWSVGAWYLEEVRRQLLAFFQEDNIRRLNVAIDTYGEDAVYQAGLHVYTAMDSYHQRQGEIALRLGLYQAAKRRGWLGAVEHVEPDKHEAWLKRNHFQPANLDNAGWARALVLRAGRDGADVRLGAYKGFIPTRTMNWCRSARNGGNTSDASRVVSPGDVVWVSAIGGQGSANPLSVPADQETKKGGVPAYDSADISPDTVIQLAIEQVPDLQGALASVEVDTGDLVAIAGGYAFSSESQFNRATQAKRQPGSSFKPVVYSAALDRGFTASTTLYDTPFELEDKYTRRVWRPGNADGKFMGPLALKTALALSRNVCTVRMAQSVGMESVIQRAHDLGIPGNIPAVLAVSLGSYEATPLTMAEAYTAFANGGNRIKARIITSIHNNWDQPLINFLPDVREAISPQNAFLMSYLLKGVVTGGTASAARVLGRPMGGKTGTSNDMRDAWFIGFTPHLVTSVFVGYDDNKPMGRSEYGGRAALPIYIKYRQSVDARYPDDDFSVPKGIVMARIDSTSGVEGVALPYMEGTAPTWTPMANDNPVAEDLMKNNMMF